MSDFLCERCGRANLTLDRIKQQKTNNTCACFLTRNSKEAVADCEAHWSPRKIVENFLNDIQCTCPDFEVGMGGHPCDCLASKVKKVKEAFHKLVGF